MMTIISNGSKWAGERPDRISKLIQVLKTHALESRFFFKCKKVHEGGKIEWIVLTPISKHNGRYLFFGNFESVSHVFNIETDNQALIKILRQAIMANDGWKQHISILKKRAK
jgi:hypothetical protein